MNFIEAARQRANERAWKEEQDRLASVRAEKDEIQRKVEEREANKIHNRAFLSEAKKAFADSGILVAVQEIVHDLDARGFEVDLRPPLIDPAWSGSVTHKLDGTHCKVEWNHRGARLASGDYFIYRFEIVFHADGVLEFTSGEDDAERHDPQTKLVPATKRYIKLTREQWMTGNDLVAECLERSYRNPIVEMFKHFPHLDEGLTI